MQQPTRLSLERGSACAPFGMTIHFAMYLGGEGRVSCRSLGFARDDKGESGAFI
jgi:hypothetical protein